VRYVIYFEQVYKGDIKSPSLKSPQKIVIHTIPDVAGNGKCKPYVEIVNGTDFQMVFFIYLKPNNYTLDLDKQAQYVFEDIYNK